MLNNTINDLRRGEVSWFTATAKVKCQFETPLGYQTSTLSDMSHLEQLHGDMLLLPGVRAMMSQGL